jgi:hypothetical protein
MPRKKKKGVTVQVNELITQPRKMASLPALNSRIGQRTMLAVLQRLQGLFNLAKEKENMRVKDRQLYFNFESEDFEVKRKSTAGYNEGDVVFNLSLSDIAEPNHYPEVREALKELLNVHVLVPIPAEPGKYRTESLMQAKLELDKDGRVVGTDFGVIIPRLAAETILDINLLGGYSRFLLFTASQFRSEYAHTLYVRLSEEWRRRHANVFDIGYEDLRQNMGFVIEKQTVKGKDGKDKEVTIDHTKKHSSWSLFCRYILDQAQQELQAMSQRTPPVTDFTFEYQGYLNGEPVKSDKFPSGIRYKRPDTIRFTIIPTSVGKQLENDKVFASQSIEARRMMAAFGLSEKQIRKFMNLARVTPDNIDGLLLMMQQLSDDLATGRKRARSRVAVAYEEIDRFLNPQVAEEVPAAEEIPFDDDSGTQTEASSSSPDMQLF